MSRVLTRSFRSWRVVTISCTAAVVLASCGVAAVHAPLTSGVPSLSIAVPLRVVGCTGSNACVTVGTAGADFGEAPVGEERLTTGGWRAITVPSVTSAMATSASCWSNECLIGGSQLSGDLVWRYDALQQSMVTMTSPAGAQGVSALSCYAKLSCAIVDSLGVVANSRLSFTNNGGASWRGSRGLLWTSAKTVTSLACSNGSNCVVAASSYHVPALVEVTHDAGATWSALATPPSWNSVTSLQCQLQQCEGLAASPLGVGVIRTRNFGETWTSLEPTMTTNALDCSTFSRCVLAGQTAANGPWLATLTNHKVKTTTLQYVPSPLTDVSCGPTICAAIGDSTLVALRP